MYQIELTKEEYRSACFMADRGYLGELTDHATTEDWSDDGGTVTLRFTESDAWKVQEVIESDYPAVWALTDRSTSLGEKFQAFLDGIV